MASNQDLKVQFKHFLAQFPELELPITLSDEAQHTFSQENNPLHRLMIEQYIVPLEDVEVDEFTEFVPCFRIPETHDFHAIVYWKAELMSYQYALVTFDKKGNFINKRVLAGTYFDGDKVTKSVATIEEDWTIHIVSGQIAAARENLYDAASSAAFDLELLPDGTIANAEL